MLGFEASIEEFVSRLALIVAAVCALLRYAAWELRELISRLSGLWQQRPWRHNERAGGRALARRVSRFVLYRRRSRDKRRRYLIQR
jgi:hypothetical protein